MEHLDASLNEYSVDSSAAALHFHVLEVLLQTLRDAVKPNLDVIRVQIQQQYVRVAVLTLDNDTAPVLFSST